MKRNEFLHKVILKLDARQQYFISSFLSVRRTGLLAQIKSFFAVLRFYMTVVIDKYKYMYDHFEKMSELFKITEISRQTLILT